MIDTDTMREYRLPKRIISDGQVKTCIKFVKCTVKKYFETNVDVCLSNILYVQNH